MQRLSIGTGIGVTLMDYKNLFIKLAVQRAIFGEVLLHLFSRTEQISMAASSTTTSLPVSGANVSLGPLSCKSGTKTPFVSKTERKKSG